MTRVVDRCGHVQRGGGERPEEGYLERRIDLAGASVTNWSGMTM